MYACQLTASPRIMESIFLLHCILPKQSIPILEKALLQKGGMTFETVQVSPRLIATKSYIGAYQSVGICTELRNLIQNVVVESTFDHWKVIDCDPLESGSRLNKMVIDIRKKKGLSEQIQPLERFLDKL